MKKTALIISMSAIGLMLANGVHATPVCYWDITGPGMAPDGQVTLGTPGNWWEHDAYACYLVSEGMKWEQYAHMFPGCDIDGDGRITVTPDAYEVYYHVGACPGGAYRPDAVCVEAYGATGETVCHRDNYRKAVADMDLIKQTYPQVELIETGQGGQMFCPAVDRILCALSTGPDFPSDLFDDLNATYGAQSRCLFQSSEGCGQLWPEFFQATNVWSVLDEYESVAQAFNSSATCELDNCFGGTATPGYHAAYIGMYGANPAWQWDIRVVDDFTCNGPCCDQTISVVAYQGGLYNATVTGSCPGY